jgi:hypothetical protein
MKRLPVAAISLVIISLILSPSNAQTFGTTNFDFWVQNFNLTLTGYGNGTPVTNGIVARVQPAQTRISSSDIINALKYQTVYTLGKALATNVTIVTNVVSKTNVYTTNVVVEAVQVPTYYSNVVYSSSAKLLIKDRIDTNGLPSLLVIRDGVPSVDYVINDYFQIRPISFDGRSQNFVFSGKVDIVHDLVDGTNFRIRGFTFNSKGLTNTPPQDSFFDVSGFATDRVGSLTEKGVIIGTRITLSSSTPVAGTGQLAGTNNFAVLRGTISTGQGKHEVQ